MGISGESCTGRVAHRIFQDTLVAYTVEHITDLFRGDDISNVRYDTEAEFIPKRVAVITIGDERPLEDQGETLKGDFDQLPEVRKF